MNSHPTTNGLSERQSAKGRNQMDIYVVYEKPSDYPDHFAVRRYQMQEVVGSPLLAESLEEARNKIPRGRVNVGRTHGDVPSLVEVWI